MHRKNGIAGLVLLALIFTALSSGCSSTSTVHMKSYFDLSFNERDFSVKKDAFYDELMSSLMKDNRFACAFASDKRVKDQSKDTFNRLVQYYPEPIVNITPHKIASKTAEALRNSFAASSNEIFSIPGAVPQLRGSRLESFDANITDSSDTRGTLGISAKFRAKRKARDFATGIQQIQDGDGAFIDLKINYTKTSATTVKFETGDLTYKIYSLGAAMLDKVDDKAIDRLIKQVSTKLQSNNEGLDTLSYRIKNEIADEIYVHRFQKNKPIETKSEKTYKVDFNAAMGRIQRKLNDYKFDPGQSTFSFKEDKNFTYCGDAPTKYSVTTRVKLFPESNGRTVAVLEASHDEVYDNLLKTSSGSAEAKKEFSDIVATIDRILEK